MMAAATTTGAFCGARTVRVGSFRGRGEADGWGAAFWTPEFVCEEFAKLIRARMLPALVPLCLALNAALIFGHLWLRPALMEVAAAAEAAGVRVDDAFIAALAARPESEESRRLLASVEQMDADSIFKHAEKSASHEVGTADTDIAAACLSAKYRAWLDRASHAFQTGAVCDVYAGAVTRDVHDMIFGTLVPALVIEASFVGVACVWYLADLDVRTGARSVVLATACGRPAVEPRLAASLIGMMGAYAALAAVTLVAVAFALGWGVGPAWGSSVSSAFNVAVWGSSVRPFIPWADFSVATYLYASLALGAVVAAGFVLMAHALLLTCGMRAVRSAAVFAACALVPLLLCKFCTMRGLSTAAALFSACPAMLLGLAPQWFTDLGFYGLTPWWETVSAVLAMCVWALVAHAALRFWIRGDVV